ncbi:MAG: SGNH/GDSL hydrolase family protein [Planctomycetota bacterium]
MESAVLIGDSIRMGYQPFVADMLDGQADVWGPEINGGTTSNVLVHLIDWVQRRRPDVLHINAGLHDIKTVLTSRRETVTSPEAYARNVKLILEIACQFCGRVIWATTTPLREYLHNARRAEAGSFLRYQADVEAFNRIAVDIAAQVGAETNDLHQVARNAGLDRIQKDDGVHFNDAGSEALARAVVTAVRQSHH